MRPGRAAFGFCPPGFPHTGSRVKKASNFSEPRFSEPRLQPCGGYLTFLAIDTVASGKVSLRFAKNKNGPTAGMPLCLEAELMRFFTREPEKMMFQMGGFAISLFPPSEPYGCLWIYPYRHLWLFTMLRKRSGTVACPVFPVSPCSFFPGDRFANRKYH